MVHPKFQSIMVSSFGITALESRESMEIDFYSDYTKNTYISSHKFVWISLQSWDLAYSVHLGLADQPRYSINPAVTCT